MVTATNVHAAQYAIASTFVASSTTTPYASVLCSGYNLNIASVTSTANSAQNTGAYNLEKVQVGGRTNAYEINCGFHNYAGSGGSATADAQFLANINTMEDCVNACSDYANNGTFACLGVNFAATGYITSTYRCGMYNGSTTGVMGSPYFDTQMRVARMLNAPAAPNVYTAITDAQYLLPTSSAVYNLGLCASASASVTAYAQATVLPQKWTYSGSNLAYSANARWLIECAGAGFVSPWANIANYAPATVAATIGIGTIATADDCQRACAACYFSSPTTGCSGGCNLWYWFNSNSTCFLSSGSSATKSTGNAWDVTGAYFNSFADSPASYKRAEAPALPAHHEHRSHRRDAMLALEQALPPSAVRPRQPHHQQHKYDRRQYSADPREVVVVN